jgi:hypothetical protein
LFHPLLFPTMCFPFPILSFSSLKSKHEA